MKDSIRDHIVEIINSYRSWIYAEPLPLQVPYLALTNGNISLTYSPALALKVICPRNGYSMNHKWTIPEFLLDMNARRMKQNDNTFWHRFVHMKLSCHDVECLIYECTYHLVNLSLDEHRPFV